MIQNLVQSQGSGLNCQALFNHRHNQSCCKARKDWRKKKSLQVVSNLTSALVILRNAAIFYPGVFFLLLLLYNNNILQTASTILTVILNAQIKHFNN